jgi:kynureninase
MARIVGALPTEVVMMNSLTCNIHLMMAAFYKPNNSRYQILIEKKAFPSDIQAMTSQILHHGLNPSECLIEIVPRDGEEILRIEDIEEIIHKKGNSIAIVHFSGVQYYTGQYFDIPRITATAHSYGCIVGFDLAHAVGNLPMYLHDWNVDFACWCSYKYLNCGPGSIGGCFVHTKHTDENSPILNRFTGWWGHRLEDRFLMTGEFIPEVGVNSFRLSNPSVLLIACVRASLDLFDKVSLKFIISLVYQLFI